MTRVIFLNAIQEGRNCDDLCYKNRKYAFDIIQYLIDVAVFGVNILGVFFGNLFF